MSCSSSDSEDEFLMFLYLVRRRNVARRHRRSPPQNSCSKPVTKVEREKESQLMTVLMSDEDKFVKHFRVGINDFQEILVLLKSDITELKTDLSDTSVLEQLAIALR